MGLIERFGQNAPAGTVLFNEHDEGEQMYVIQSGTVRLTRTIRGEEKLLADIGAGEFFGEMAILNKKPRSATATVIADAQLLVIDPKTFEAMIKANTEIAVRMIKKLAKRLDDANEQIETLLLRDTNSRVVFNLLNTARSMGIDSAGGLQVPASIHEIAGKTSIDMDHVEQALERMERSQLIHRAGDLVTIPDLTKLEEFLEFLEMREKFGSV